MRRLSSRLFAALLSITATSSHATDARESEWITPAEAAQFKTTPSYADTQAYLQRLAAAAPATLKFTRFGVSPEGRDLMLVIAASGGEFTPLAARASGKQILFVQAGIHAGEIEGKDAGLMLLRDLAIGNKLAHALDHSILIYAPIFNVDGHENSNPYMRINQNGPAAMGSRRNAQNLNLNRDYMKADTPEMQAWLNLWNAWLPDFFIDLHTTDGADYQYDLTWYTEDWGPLDAGIKAWQNSVLKMRIFPQVEKHGHLLSPYIDLVDHLDIRKGLDNFGSGPRFSTGYVALHNRAALLVETHMLKSYETRVRASYDLIAAILDDWRAHPGELRRAVDAADSTIIARAADSGGTLPIMFEQSQASQTIALKGIAFTQRHSDISGSTWTHYEPGKREIFQVPLLRDLVASESAQLPAAYLVPAGWPQIIDKLKQHGLHVETLAQDVTLDVQQYQLDAPQWAKAPFEGHFLLDAVEANPQLARQTFPAGSALVTLDQRAANVAVQLLEPRAADSLLRWGFFNAIFEQQEYADARVLEQLARDMLAKDPALKSAFETRLKSDPAFAASARARLDFFYRRSPWYANQHVGLYPVVKLDQSALRAARGDVAPAR